MFDSDHCVKEHRPHCIPLYVVPQLNQLAKLSALTCDKSLTRVANRFSGSILGVGATARARPTRTQPSHERGRPTVERRRGASSEALGGELDEPPVPVLNSPYSSRAAPPSGRWPWGCADAPSSNFPSSVPLALHAHHLGPSVPSGPSSAMVARRLHGVGVCYRLAIVG
jgi:hypothetical protein